MRCLTGLFIILIPFSPFIWYGFIIIYNMIKKYKQNQLFIQQELFKKQESIKQVEAINNKILIKQHMKEVNKRLDLIKQQEAIKQQELIKQKAAIKQQEEEEEKYDNILLLIIIECFNNKLEPINKIIKKNINKCKHTNKLDKNINYEFNDIFNGASIEKQIDLIKLIFSLDNVKNKQYLKDNIFIDYKDTVNESLEYGIKNNIYDLCEFVFESKSYKIDLDKYDELEKIIINKEIYLLLIKHKIEDVYSNIIN
jgi:hypothetical protein